ncbi:MAG: Ig-like domain-containing protein, partial [Petrotogales bacterium]
IDVIAEASDNESGIKMVNFYIDGQLMDTVYIPPYKWTWNERIFIGHTVKVEAYDNNDNKAEDSDSVLIFNFFPDIRFGTLKGKVVGGILNLSVPGVRVTAKSGSFEKFTFTRRIPFINRGYFILRIPPGRYILTLEKNGFVTQQKEVRVFFEGNEDLRFELDRAYKQYWPP